MWESNRSEINASFNLILNGNPSELHCTLCILEQHIKISLWDLSQPHNNLQLFKLLCFRKLLCSDTISVIIQQRQHNLLSSNICIHYIAACSMSCCWEVFSRRIPLEKTSSPHLFCHSNTQSSLKSTLMEITSPNSVNAMCCDTVDVYMFVLFTLYFFYVR